MMTTEQVWNAAPKHFKGTQLQWIKFCQNHDEIEKAEKRGKPLDKMERFKTVDDQVAHITDQAIMESTEIIHKLQR